MNNSTDDHTREFQIGDMIFAVSPTLGENVLMIVKGINQDSLDVALLGNKDKTFTIGKNEPLEFRKGVRRLRRRTKP